MQLERFRRVRPAARSSRLLCALGNIKKMPIVQVYAQGTLCGVSDITTKALVLEFQTTLAMQVMQTCTFTRVAFSS